MNKQMMIFEFVMLTVAMISMFVCIGIALFNGGPFGFVCGLFCLAYIAVDFYRSRKHK